MQLQKIITLTPGTVMYAGASYHTVKTQVIRGYTYSQLLDGLNMEDNFVPKDDGTDVMYFFGGCKVPRFKVRKKYKITNDPYKATACFIDLENIEETSKTFKILKHYTSVRFEGIRHFMEDLHDQNAYLRFASIAANEYDKILVHQDFFLERSWMNGKWSSKTVTDNRGVTRNKSFREYYSTGVYDLSIHKSQYIFIPQGKDVLLNLQAPVHDQVEMIKLINADKMTIDTKMYTQLCEQIEAGDDDFSLAMELIANCNFEKSLIYLLTLLYQYKDKFSSSKHRDQVNFQSLLKYLDLDRNLSTLDLDKIIDVLHDHKQFTKDNLGIVSMMQANDTRNIDPDRLRYFKHGVVLNEHGMNLLNN